MTRLRRPSREDGYREPRKQGREQEKYEEKKGGGVLTCENHYSNSNSNTTFLLKRRPSPHHLASLAGPIFQEIRKTSKENLSRRELDAKERDAHVCEQYSVLDNFACMCYEVS